MRLRVTTSRGHYNITDTFTNDSSCTSDVIAEDVEKSQKRFLCKLPWASTTLSNIFPMALTQLIFSSSSQSKSAWHSSPLTICPQRAVARLHKFTLRRLRQHHNVGSLLNHFIMDTPPFTPTQPFKTGQFARVSTLEVGGWLQRA